MRDILIIEDSKQLAETLQSFCRLKGYDSEVCYSGECGLTRLQERKFDIILLDHYMEGKSGLSIMSDIKKISDAKIIFITGKMIVNEDLALLNGADFFLKKPFDIMILDRVINALL